MPVKKDPEGHRSVEAEVEVPGTPEEVWNAIATGPGMSSWFVPSTSEERVGGTAVCNFGPGMESVATIKEWDPPVSFTAETEEEPGLVASEWTVETRGGGTCVVRVVHRWFADTDEWDDQFIGHSYGWISFFRILRIYLEHFRSRPSASFQIAAFGDESVEQTWRLALDGLPASADDPKRLTTPSAAGVVEHKGEGEYAELLLRLDDPAPGVAHLFPMDTGEQTMLSVRVYLYGDGVEGDADSTKKRWADWLSRTFPRATVA